MKNTYKRLLNLVTEMDVRKSLGKLTIRPSLTPEQKAAHKAIVDDQNRAKALADRLKNKGKTK